MSQKHICEAAALHCIDFRIQRYLNEYLEGRFPGKYDRVVIAGGVKELPLEQFDISARLHDPKIVVLIQHEDCGAYGGSESLGDFEAELKFQKSELANAEQKLREHFADAGIEKFFVRLSGEMLAV